MLTSSGTISLYGNVNINRGFSLCLHVNKSFSPPPPNIVSVSLHCKSIPTNKVEVLV